jgi:hypothetical protein
MEKPLLFFQTTMQRNGIQGLQMTILTYNNNTVIGMITFYIYHLIYNGV